MKCDFKFTYDRYDSTDALPEDERQLILQAQEACKTAYAPYSEFNVGAAALLESGRTVIGSNQESEVFPAGICAAAIHFRTLIIRLEPCSQSKTFSTKTTTC